MFLTRGHYRADIDVDDLDNVQVSITMGISLETSEALLHQAEETLDQEFSELRLMIHDYVNFLHQLREEELAYAV